MAYSYLNSILAGTTIKTCSVRPCDTNMVTIYYTIRTCSDDRPYEDLECSLEMTQAKADAICLDSDYFDEDEFNNFCEHIAVQECKRQHPGHSVYYDWYFRSNPDRR